MDFVCQTLQGEVFVQMRIYVILQLQDQCVSIFFVGTLVASAALRVVGLVRYNTEMPEGFDKK